MNYKKSSMQKKPKKKILKIFLKSIIINFKQYDQTISKQYSNNIQTIFKQYDQTNFKKSANFLLGTIKQYQKIKFIYKQKLKSRHEKNIIQLPMVKQDQLYPKIDQISKKKSKD